MYSYRETIYDVSQVFWPTVLSVAPLAHCVVCLSVCLSSVVCDVLYPGETVHPGVKVSITAYRKSYT